MFKRSTLICLAASFFLAACSDPHGSVSATTPPAPTAAPGALAAAHEAYLAGDFLTVGDRIRDVLLDPTSGDLAKANALELLDKSYEATKGALPSRFAFPAEVRGMELGALNGQSPSGPYRSFYLWVRIPENLMARMTNLTVTRLPDAVLLDRVSSRGTMTTRHEKPGYIDVDFALNNLDTLPTDGVFSVRIEIDGAPLLDTWLLASRLVASTTPDVLAPTAAASLTDENPIIRWTPYRSPESGSFEQRTLSVHIQDSKAKKAAWNLWLNDATGVATVRVGDHPNAPATKLAPGPYWLALTEGENRSFGPISLARRAQAGLPFNVVK